MTKSYWKAVRDQLVHCVVPRHHIFEFVLSDPSKVSQGVTQVFKKGCLTWFYHFFYWQLVCGNLVLCRLCFLFQSNLLHNRDYSCAFSHASGLVGCHTGKQSDKPMVHQYHVVVLVSHSRIHSLNCAFWDSVRPQGLQALSPGNKIRNPLKSLYSIQAGFYDPLIGMNAKVCLFSSSSEQSFFFFFHVHLCFFVFV